MEPRTGLAGAPAPAGFVERVTISCLALVAMLLCSPAVRVLADDLAPAAELGARARVPAPPDDPAALGAGELEALRAGLGDNFNPTDALPGTLQLFSGVPYLMVRGAPPAASAQYLDGVLVPALFHLALGPAITHPSLFGSLEFHPGVAPARYGRHTGAVLSASGKPSRPHQGRSEVEARLLDAQAFTLRPTLGLALHARLGYPQGMLSLVGSDAELGYWDYHARWDHSLDGGGELEVAAFGAGDRVGTRGADSDDIALEFHRGVVRLRRALPALEFAAQLVGGYERGRLGSELTATTHRVGPAVWMESTADPDARLRIGADLEAKRVRLRRTSDDDGGDMASALPAAPAGMELMPAPETVPQLEADAAEFLDRAPLARSGPRAAFGAYAEFELGASGAVGLSGGLRADFWLAAGQMQQAFDPRLLLRARLAPGLSVHAALARTHQAAASPLPIPGLTDYELDTGLQSALQSEAGVRLALPWQLRLAATGFYHAFSQLIFLELIVDCEGNSDPLPREAPLPAELQTRPSAQPVSLCARRGLPRGEGNAYGMELSLSRSSPDGLSGWLSYTLARADAKAADGTRFVPQFDVRHLLNLVLAYAWGAGFESGLRLHFRSGKPAVNTIFDFAQGHLQRLHTRLPPFVRLDLSFGYHWATRWGGLWITLQWLNLTFAREATKRDCRFDAALAVRCELDYQPAVVLPNAGVRAVF